MKKQPILVLMLLGFILAFITACEPISAEPPAASLSASTDSVPDGDEARVVYVIDGDTIDVEVNGEEYRLRYIGVDTPERDEPYYDEATAANRSLVEDQTVILVKDVSDTDQYGRLLRYVYLPDGTFVNALMIADGYGRVVSFPPDVAYLEAFTELQTDARENQRGLWSLNEFQALPDGCDTCSKNAYDCRDFDTQPQAQACYQTCLDQTGEDVHRLDGGGDGRVCESLPAR